MHRTIFSVCRSVSCRIPASVIPPPCLCPCSPGSIINMLQRPVCVIFVIGPSWSYLLLVFFLSLFSLHNTRNTHAPCRQSYAANQPTSAPDLKRENTRQTRLTLSPPRFHKPSVFPFLFYTFLGHVHCITCVHSFCLRLNLLVVFCIRFFFHLL